MNRALFPLLVLLLAPACTRSDAPVPPSRPVDAVEPRIGSGGWGFAHGSAFPGAAAPHGLAKVGPDTRGPYGTIRFLHYSGYWYGDDRLQGFSHVHLHGTGATDYGLLTVMPLADFSAERTSVAGYESSFRKSSEVATPGYYSLLVDRGRIRAEITATEHAAHHRYTWPASAERWLLFDLGKHLDGGTVTDSEFELLPAERRVRGRIHHEGDMSGGFGGYDLFFDAIASDEWSEAQVWSGGGAPHEGVAESGDAIGFALSFASDPELQVGISLVSPEGAISNRFAELPAWDFDATHEATANAWNDRLSVVRIQGGSESERRVFYSALYRCYLMPTLVGDAGGSYLGMDGAIHASPGFNYVSDLSLWDTYRTLHPLYALLAPRDARDAAASLHEMAKQGGAFPKWPIATGESGTMLGASAEIVLADAWLRGVQDFDANGAYALMRAAALDPVPPAGGRGGRNGIEPYLTLGYVPAGGDRPVSLTTEFAHDDFALANLARALGHNADADLFLARSHGWRQLYDPASGFLRLRNADGSWNQAVPPDPRNFGDEFAEANAWQSVWAAPHDVEGLMDVMGGRDAFVVRLEEFFELAKTEWDAIPADDIVKLGSPRPYFWAGNEPDIHAPWLFAQAGRPDLAAKWVRWVRESFFPDGPHGLPGNDDGGTLSSWYVLSSLGLYPLPGSDLWIFGKPAFAHAEVDLAGGTLTIRTVGRGASVRAVSLDGVKQGSQIRHADLVSGSELVFELGD